MAYVTACGQRFELRCWAEAHQAECPRCQERIEDLKEWEDTDE